MAKQENVVTYTAQLYIVTWDGVNCALIISCIYNIINVGAANWPSGGSCRRDFERCVCYLCDLLCNKFCVQYVPVGVFPGLFVADLSAVL